MMNNCSCSSIIDGMGFHCTRMAGGVIYLSTPFTLRSGKPIDFYIQEFNDGYRVEDDGLTVFSLSSTGYSFENRNHLRWLDVAAKSNGFELESSGNILGFFRNNQYWGGNLLSLCAEIKRWEMEYSVSGKYDGSLVDYVEKLLLKKNPSLKLTQFPKLNVVDTTGGVQEFDFQFLWGDIYVDALKSNKNSTNAKLRKSLLLKDYLDKNKILYLIDDRDGEKKASEEVSLLNSVATAMSIKEFEISEI